MLWATAREAGVSLLLSEDFSDGSVLDGVRVVNPLVHDDLPSLLGLKS
jgi:predicted nucleic acid-binding protein